MGNQNATEHVANATNGSYDAHITTKTIYDHSTRQNRNSERGSMPSSPSSVTSNTTTSSFHKTLTPPSPTTQNALEFPSRQMHPTKVSLQNGVIVPVGMPKGQNTGRRTDSVSSVSSNNTATSRGSGLASRHPNANPRGRIYGVASRAQRKRRYSLRTRQLVRRVEQEEQVNAASGLTTPHSFYTSSFASHHGSSASTISSMSNLRGSTYTSDQDISILEYDRKSPTKRSDRRRRRGTNRVARVCTCLFLWPLLVCNAGKPSNSNVENINVTDLKSQHAGKIPSPGKRSFERTSSARCSCLGCLTDVDEDSTVISSSSHLASRSQHMSTNCEHAGGVTPHYYSSGDHLDDEYTHGSSLSESSRCPSRRATKDTFKVVLLGSRGVGKSSFINVIENNPFSHHYSPTTGIQFSTIDCHHTAGDVKLQFYDASGEEEDDERIAVYYDDVDAVIFLYSVVDEKSFSDFEQIWYKEYKECTAQTDGEELIITILFGNKVDIRDQEDDGEQLTTDPSQVQLGFKSADMDSSASTISHNVSYKDGAQLANKLDCLFFEGSTLTKQNTAVLLNTLTAKFRATMLPRPSSAHDDDISSVLSDH